MLPETREERRTRLAWMLDKGLLGDTPQESRRNFLDMAQFPNMARAVRVGGVDAVTAGQENGELLRGQPVPVLPWYDHAVHIAEAFARDEDARIPEARPGGAIRLPAARPNTRAVAAADDAGPRS